MALQQVNTSASGLLLLSCGSLKPSGPCQLSTHITVQKHPGEIALSLLTMKTHRWTLTYLFSHVHGWKLSWSVKQIKQATGFELLWGAVFHFSARQTPYWLMMRCFSIRIQHVHKCFNTLFLKILIPCVKKQEYTENPWDELLSLPFLCHNLNVPE